MTEAGRRGKDDNWNFGVNLLDNMFYTLAISLVSQETIMPLLVSQLSGSPVAAGLTIDVAGVAFKADLAAAWRVMIK